MQHLRCITAKWIANLNPRALAMATKIQESPNRTSTDRIERNIEVRAPRSRVWRAISNAKEFGTWFRMNVEGEFAEGAKLRGRITHPGYEHVTLDLFVESMEPERYFSYRWHPHALDTSKDYSAEPMTLVEFILNETEEGTAVTIVESGFDQLPAERRDEAFRSNGNGWTGQIKNLAQYVA
jgi:uncharacterized protein YndB with AHSA1/START domain